MSCVLSGWQLCQCFRSDLAAQLAACVESARLLHTTAELSSLSVLSGVASVLFSVHFSFLVYCFIVFVTSDCLVCVYYFRLCLKVKRTICLVLLLFSCCFKSVLFLSKAMLYTAIG